MEKIENVQREISAVDRPSTAMRQQNLDDINDKGRENWQEEKGKKLLELKQLESKSFHLAREVKHRARQHASEVAALKYQISQAT